MDVFTLVGRLALEGADKVEKQLDGIGGYIKDHEKQFKAVGAALTGVGVAITGFLTLATKAAAEEDAGIQRLAQSLKNVGVSYDNVKDSLEANITAMQDLTSIADDQQREALSQLVAITGDYNEALKLLPLAMDMSVGAGMDLVTASEVLGRVSEGNTTILSRYGIQLKEGATATEALAAIQQKYTGQAEAYGKTVAGQFNNIKNQMGDLMEVIGSTLLPIVSNLITNYITPLIKTIQKWIAENPTLAKTIIVVVGAVGAIAAVVGPLLIMLPSLAAGFQLLLGPIGWVSLAITALVAIGTTLYMNWDKVQHFFKILWENIKIAFAEAVKFIINVVLKPWMLYIENVLGNILLAFAKVVGFFNKEWGAAIENAANYVKNLSSNLTNLADKIEGEARANKVVEDSRYAAAQAAKEHGEAVDGEAASIDNLGLSIANATETQKQFDEQNKTSMDTYIQLIETRDKLNASIEGGVTWLAEEGRFVSNTQLAIEALNDEIIKNIEHTHNMTAAIEKYGEAAVNMAYYGNEEGMSGEQHAILDKAIWDAWERGGRGGSGGENPYPSFGVSLPGSGYGGYYQHGGPIPEPTLLTSLKTGMSYAIAGEHGPERVVSGQGGNTINIVIPESVITNRQLIRENVKLLVRELQLQGIY